MKKIIILPILALALFGCNVAGEDDYENMAKDACDCVNKTTEGISERGLQMLIDSKGDESKFEADFIQYMLEDQTAAMNDAEAFKRFGTELPACVKSLETKYSDVYAMGETEKEIQKKIITKLREIDGCEQAADLIELGSTLQ